jgi:hypothetical protein
MDLGPLAGMRAITLLNAQKAKAEQAHFEIDAAARTGDEPASHQQQTDRRKPDEEEFRPAAAPEQPASDSTSAEPVVDSEGQNNWFV